MGSWTDAGRSNHRRPPSPRARSLLHREFGQHGSDDRTMKGVVVAMLVASLSGSAAAATHGSTRLLRAFQKATGAKGPVLRQLINGDVVNTTPLQIFQAPFGPV